MPTDPKAVLYDYAHGILNTSDLSDADKESLWDEVHQSDGPSDLRTRLQNYPQVSPELTQELVEGRGAMPSVAPPPAPQFAGTKALLELQRIPPEVLATASAHPEIAKALIAAAAKTGNGEE